MFANVTLGDWELLLSGPGASGSRPMPHGEPQEAGGWNRVALKVADLSAFIAGAGQHFATRWKWAPAVAKCRSRTNPIELFEPAR